MNALHEVLTAAEPDLDGDLLAAATAEVLRSLRHDRRVRTVTDLAEVRALCRSQNDDDDVRIFERRTSPADESDVDGERTACSPARRPGVAFDLSDEHDFDEPCSQEILRLALSRGVQARRASLPYRLHLYGRTTAVLPLDRFDNSAGSVVVEEPEAVRALLELYRQVWVRARPIPPHLHVERKVPVELVDLLQQLVSGRSDEAAAAHLHLSLRTYRRRVHELMQCLGVQNRFAAGAVAQERGYLGMTGP